MTGSSQAPQLRQPVQTDIVVQPQPFRMVQKSRVPSPASGLAIVSAVLWFSNPLGHGGHLSQARGGAFTKIDLARLNWWLKDDETATGKGLLVGAGCPCCSGGAWEYMSAHVP